MFKNKVFKSFLFTLPMFAILLFANNLTAYAHSSCNCNVSGCTAHTHSANQSYWHPCHSKHHTDGQSVKGNCVSVYGAEVAGDYCGGDVNVCGPGTCWVVDTSHYSTGHKFGDYSENDVYWSEWYNVEGSGTYLRTEFADNSLNNHVATPIYSSVMQRDQYVNITMDCKICKALFDNMRTPNSETWTGEIAGGPVHSAHEWSDPELTLTIGNTAAKNNVINIDNRTYSSSNGIYDNVTKRAFYLYTYCKACGHVSINRANTITMNAHPCSENTQFEHTGGGNHLVTFEVRPTCVFTSYKSTLKNFSCARDGDKIISGYVGAGEPTEEVKDEKKVIPPVQTGNLADETDYKTESSQSDSYAPLHLDSIGLNNKMFKAPVSLSDGFRFVTWSSVDYTPSIKSQPSKSESWVEKKFKTNTRKDIKDDYTNGEDVVLYKSEKEIKGRKISEDFQKAHRSKASKYDVTRKVDPEVNMYAVWHENYYKVKFHANIAEKAEANGAPPKTLALDNVPFKNNNYLDNAGKAGDNGHQWYYDKYMFNSNKERKKIPSTRWYNFVGWATDSEKSDAIYCTYIFENNKIKRQYNEMTTRGTGNGVTVDLYGRWEPKEYQIYFHGTSYDGKLSGMVDKDSKDYTTGKGYSINKEAPLWKPTSAYKTGYYIDCWQIYNWRQKKLINVPLDYSYTNDAGKTRKNKIPAFPIGKWEGSTTPYGSINFADCIDPEDNTLHLYPVWKPYTYTVTFKNANGFTGSDLSVVLKYDESMYLFNNTPNITTYPNNDNVRIAAGSTPHFQKEGYYVSAWRPEYRDCLNNYEATHGNVYISTGTGYTGADVATAQNILVKNLITPGLARGVSGSNHTKLASNHNIMFNTKIDLYVHESAIKYYTRYNNDTTVPTMDNKYPRDLKYTFSGGPTSVTYYYDQVYDIPKLGYTRANKYGASEFLGWCYRLGDTSSTPQFACKAESPKDILKLPKMSTTVSDKLLKPNASPGVSGDTDKASGRTAEGWQYGTYFAYLPQGKVQTFDLYAVYDDCPGIEPIDLEALGGGAKDWYRAKDNRSKSGTRLESYILFDIGANIDSIWDREDEATQQRSDKIRLNKNNYYIDRFSNLDWEHPETVTQTGLTDVAHYSLRYVVKDRRNHMYTVEKKLCTGEYKDIQVHENEIGLGQFRH